MARAEELADKCSTQDARNSEAIRLSRTPWYPLRAPSRKVYVTLKARGFEATLREYNGPHAFFALPPRWISAEVYKEGEAALQELVQFLDKLDSLTPRS